MLGNHNNSQNNQILKFITEARIWVRLHDNDLYTLNHMNQMLEWWQLLLLTYPDKSWFYGVDEEALDIKRYQRIAKLDVYSADDPVRPILR